MYIGYDCRGAHLSAPLQAVSSTMVTMPSVVPSGPDADGVPSTVDENLKVSDLLLSYKREET